MSDRPAVALDRCVRGAWRPASLDSLRRYFRQDGPSKALYSGRLFDRFAGGGDAPAVRDQVTAEDVLALNFLSIKDRLGMFAVDVLEMHKAEIAEVLGELPTDVAMHEVSWAMYADDSAAYQLWDLLRRCGGKNLWVYANKLLARKRPHLLPVYDRDVQRCLHHPANYWACLWNWFAGDPSRVVALAELRTDARDVEDISLLRCLDVVVWMRATRRTGDDELQTEGSGSGLAAVTASDGIARRNSG